MRRPTAKPIDNGIERHPVYDYKPPAYFRALKWGGIGVAALMLIVALYVGYWYYAAGQLRDGVLSWIEEHRAEGMTVTYTQLDIGGFPDRLHIRIDKPNIAAPSADTPWGWEGAAIEAEMPPWNPSHVRIGAAGDHAFLFGADADLIALQGRAETAEGTFVFSRGTLAEASVFLAGVDLAVAGGRTAWKLDRGRLEADLAPDSDEDEQKNVTLDARLELNGFRLPAGLNLPLGSDFERIDLTGSLIGTIAPGPLAPALTVWRDGGGIIEVRRLSGVYGPLNLHADGTLALDATLQPIGAFTARIGGFFETIDALRTRGIIRARDAVTAKMVLGVLAKRSADGHGGLTIPLAIQEQTLFAGPVPLLDIPDVTWPGGEQTAGQK